MTAHLRRTRQQPLVSVIMPTRDRPEFLKLALACYAQQTYARRELLVVDDGDIFPADADAVRAAGGRLLRVPTDTTLGAKLNLGASEARGTFCQNFDDDDWYAPQFIDQMVSAVVASWETVCRPTVALVRPFLLFDVRRWQIRRSRDDGYAGATLLFGRDDALAVPFRDVRHAVDTHFLEDQRQAGAVQIAVQALESFLAVRHGGGVRVRGHTWTELFGGGSVDADMQQRPRYARGPEVLLPAWACDRYREIRRGLLSADVASESP